AANSSVGKEELLRQRSPMVRGAGGVDVQHPGDAEERADQPKEMAERLPASMCRGRRAGAQRWEEMDAVEPDGTTERGDGSGGTSARRRKSVEGIARQAKSGSKMADRQHPPMPQEVDAWSSLSVRSPTHAGLLLVAAGNESVRARAGSTNGRGLRLRDRPRLFVPLFPFPL